LGRPLADSGKSNDFSETRKEQKMGQISKKTAPCAIVSTHFFSSDNLISILFSEQNNLRNHRPQMTQIDADILSYQAKLSAKIGVICG